MKHYIHAYVAPSGQWAGRVIEGEEVAGVAGCETANEAVAALIEQFPDAKILSGFGPD